jgi:hypothetical protein
MINIALYYIFLHEYNKINNEILETSIAQQYTKTINTILELNNICIINDLRKLYLLYMVKYQNPNYIDIEINTIFKNKNEFIKINKKYIIELAQKSYYRYIKN